jgi:hypothetical protein
MGQDGAMLLRSDLRRGEVVVIKRDGEGGIVMKKMIMRVRISESEMVFKAIIAMIIVFDLLSLCCVEY